MTATEKKNDGVRESVYCYTMKNVTPQCYKGVLYIMGRENAWFQPDGRNKKLRCNAQPGVIYNQIFWLPERDDLKAREIFLAYEEEQIDILLGKIRYHKTNIALLQTVSDIYLAGEKPNLEDIDL